MRTLRFLQFSDLGFENREYIFQWGCTREKTEIVERETRDVLERIVALAKERQVEALFIPGDLFDHRTVSLEGIRFLQDCFRGLGGIPVFVSPGDEDFYGASSFYNSDFLRAIGMKPWPENVHIFAEKPCSHAMLPGHEEIVITGIPHLGRCCERVNVRDLPITKDPERLNILIGHGPWENDGCDGRRAAVAFPGGDAETQGFDYVAYGHVKGAEEVADTSGRIRSAASGCPYGRKIDEVGQKTILLGEVEKGGIQPGKFERIRVALRTTHEMTVRCGRLKQMRSLQQRIERALHREHIEAMDSVVIRFEGQAPEPLLWKIYEDSLKDMVFRVKVDTSRVEPTFNFRKYTQGSDGELTTEGLFVRRLKGCLDQAGDGEERKSIIKALEWGLRALGEKTIGLTDENQEA